MEAAGISGEPPELAYFTQDTYVNSHTNLCARLAAGSCVDVATAVTRWVGMLCQRWRNVFLY